MKHTTCLLVMVGLLAKASALAQTPLTSGTITYEGLRRIDPSQMRMVINGQDVRPGSPGAPEPPDGMPEAISFVQKLVFAGGMAKEERDRPQNMTIRRPMGDGERNGQSVERRLKPPVEQTTFLDLANRQRIDVLTITSDSVRTTYRAERPMPTAENWQPSDKTKTIAGYLCHKATATARLTRRPMAGRSGPAAAANAVPAESGSGETFTVWYTTDLPFTYSPIASLTPEKGVVLQIESDNESFKATGIALEPVDAADVRPTEGAKAVTPDELNELRRKAMADFRQQMLNSRPFPGARN